MTKEAIIQNIQDNHYEFVELLFSLSKKEFMYSFHNKWTAGQHFEHIYLSVSPLAKAMKLPPLFLKIMFGKANRPSKDYDALVKKYHDTLEKGGTASGRFVPKQIDFEDKLHVKRKLMKSVDHLCKKLNGYSESKLDHYILPHPLLGKLTIREMLYFTIYHVEHHRKLVLQTVAII